MRHDRHFVEELAEQAVTAIGLMLPVERIEANREQPRAALGDLTELASSIRARGVLEPLIVRKLTDGSNKYQLIAGERRLHAAIEAGLSEVPCIEFAVSDQEALELALVENLQRKDLTPFEEAEGFRTLVEKYGYTHDQVAAAVGKSRPTVSEAVKLLDIPPAIRDLCRHADITAKSVLLLIARAGSIDEMERLVQEIAERGLDRFAARAIAQQPESVDGAAPDVSPEDAQGSADSSAFRPIQIRFRPTPDAPVHLALSIRRPGVSRNDLIATVEDLLDRLRNGDLDDRLRPPTPKPPA
jgi:ParB family chromosome partitioning protein